MKRDRGRSARRTPQRMTSPSVKKSKSSPVFTPPSGSRFTFRGHVGERIEANLHNWLLCAPAANPAMLQMMRDRDRTPSRELVPWAGEFAGKYLISAVLGLRLTRNRNLRNTLKSFVSDLIQCQDSDGYLGPFPRASRLIGPGLWDLWGHYHCMLGLLLWYRDTGDEKALAACRRSADLFCRTFLDDNFRVVHAGSEEMNESSIHIFCLLYQETGESRYLQMAHEIECDWETPPSGDYLRTALSDKAFYQCPKPRWESLHSVQALPELYFITGKSKYRRAFEQIWWSIVEHDRHNSGGFSSGEKATGNPYDPGAIETCCTIAWMAITVDMLRMTGNAHAADELELSTFNAVLGAQNPTGRWWTYNTPMDGERKASAHDIVFQARAGSSELNCCSVNGPRGLGMLSEWAAMVASDGIVINYYGPCEFLISPQSGTPIRIRQETDYPVSDEVRLRMTPGSKTCVALYLRIPGWSRTTKVTLNGRSLPEPRRGTYLKLQRNWKASDEIHLNFDMSSRLWVGERESLGRASIYHGPMLLAYDARFDVHDPSELPVVEHRIRRSFHRGWSIQPRPLLLLSFATRDDEDLTLCDFASAGAAGNRYVSWIPFASSKPARFDRINPLRAVWTGHGRKR